MAETWEDLVTPVRRVANAMVDYLPGYATEREKFQRRVREGGPNRRDVVEAVFNAMSAVGAGPRPGAFGRAAQLEAIPQRDPAITGGSSRFDPTPARGSVADLSQRSGMRSATEMGRRTEAPPRSALQDNVNPEAGRIFTAPLGPNRYTPAPLTNAEISALPFNHPARLGRPQPVPKPGSDKGGPPAGQAKGGEPPVPVTQERAVALLEEMGAKVTQIKNVRGTTYIKFEDPAQPHLPFQAQPTIRIPADQHAGRPPRPGEAGVLFDTASRPGRGPVNPLTATDEAGRPYADFNVLESTLRRRFGQTPEPNAPRPQGPDNSPDQPRLLSVAAPAAVGWTATVTQEPPEMAAREIEDQGNAGRFAAPLVSPDAQLAADTRSLSDRVSVATRNIESDFDWSDLVVPVTPHAMAGIRRASNAMAGY